MRPRVQLLFDVSQAANGSCPQIGEIAAPSPSFGDKFGVSIANGGDINGDGSDDLVVGSPGADLNPTVGDNTGRVFVYNSTTGSLIASFTSEYPNRQGAPTGFGASIARAGNLYRRFSGSGSNVRALSALLVGAPYEGGSSNPNAGAAYVFGCSEGAALPCIPGKRQRLLGDSSPNGYFGMSVAAVGDLEQFAGSTVPLGIAVGAPQAVGEVRATGGNVIYFDGDCRAVNGGCRHAGASGNTVDADTMYGDSLATLGDTGGNAAAVELAVLEPMNSSATGDPSRTEVRTTLEGIPFANYGYTPRQKSLAHGCTVQNIAFTITVSTPRVNDMNCGGGGIPCARLRVKSGTVPAPANAKIECSVGALLRPRMLATDYFNGPTGASTCEVGVATSAAQSFSFYAQADGSFDVESRFKLMPHLVGEIRGVQCRVVEVPTQSGTTTFPLYAAPTSNEQVFSVGCPDNGQVCPGL
jgi:FG-GAP repeat